ncbi:MAG: hypothetical protein LBG11_11555 [Bifidobacteriaceae bacterium]|jgi:hypothetical protein|nr:hypothetical protein [Bifidobacteriaceae bacterium]
MGQGDVQARVPLTVLAGEYETIKDQVAAKLHARHEATRFGGTPLPDPDPPPEGKQDARRIAAQQLGAGVSHTTLEKILWLRRIAFDMDRRGSLRSAAWDALEAVGASESVSGPYDRINTLVLIDDLEQEAAEAPPGSIVSVVATRELKRLRRHGVASITPAMKRHARQALACARETDQDINDLVRGHAPALRQLQGALKRKRTGRQCAAHGETG